jgi:hypothetical protein
MEYVIYVDNRESSQLFSAKIAYATSIIRNFPPK